MSTYILLIVLQSNFGYGHTHSIDMSTKATCEAAAKKFNNDVAKGNSIAFCVEK